MDEQNQPIATQESKPKKKIDKKTIVIIALAILALGGIAFGVFELLENNKKDTQIAKLKSNYNYYSNNYDYYYDDSDDNAETEAEEETEPSPESDNQQTSEEITYPIPSTAKGELDLLVKSLAEKYTTVKGCGVDVFELASKTSNKVGIKLLIALANTDLYRSNFSKEQSGKLLVPASNLEAKYEELFGNSSEIESKEYILTRGGLVFEPIEEYGSKSYKFTPYGAGCGGFYSITEYDGYNIDDGILTVSMIHDEARYDQEQKSDNWYITLKNGEKIEFPSNNSYTNQDYEKQKEAVPAIIEQYGSQLQHYYLVFTRKSDRYVLTSVIKE